MPVKAPSIFADGWTKEKQDLLDRTNLPEKLRCKQCNKLKSIPGFSQRQLGVAKQSLARNPRLNGQGTAVIVCRQCTEGQVMELECSQCGYIKSLEGFTKAQRRDPDFARCIDCVNKHLRAATAADETAELQEHSDLDDDEEDDDDDVNTSDHSDAKTNPYAESGDDDSEESTAGLASRTEQLHVDDNKSRRAPISHASNNGAGGQWRQYSGQHGGANLDYLHENKDPKGYISYDAAGTAHTRVHSPSTVASNPPGVAPRSNFARIGAYKPPRSPESNKSTNPEPKVYPGDGCIRVSATAAAAKGRQRDAHDSDSDSDFGCI